VVGFPLGAMSTDGKLAETDYAISCGAAEIDTVINVGHLKDGKDDDIVEELKALSSLCHEKGAILKVIIETCLLSDEEKITACRLVTESGADFIKTSTGFSTGGATVSDIKLLRANVGEHVKIKASGGIRTLDDTLKFIDAGADRLGCSASISIMKEYLKDRESLR
ncbi:MAG: deoxyribose-phosphate aldolase, partial [Firmicutes bacterium]|nr:deoxyribose-phosphate aldolase [Bacillota bacterium]